MEKQGIKLRNPHCRKAENKIRFTLSIWMQLIRKGQLFQQQFFRETFVAYILFLSYWMGVWLRDIVSIKFSLLQNFVSKESFLYFFAIMYLQITDKILFWTYSWSKLLQLCFKLLCIWNKNSSLIYFHM